MDVKDAMKKRKHGKKKTRQMIGKNNLEAIKKRLSDWQLESFNVAYEYEINNGTSLFEKNQVKE